MADMTTDADNPYVELLAGVDHQLVRLGGRERDELFRCLSDTDRRAWEEFERLIDSHACITPSEWPSPHPSRIVLSVKSQAMFAVLRDLLERFRPAESLGGYWSRQPSPAALAIRRVVHLFDTFNNLTRGSHANTTH